MIWASGPQRCSKASRAPHLWCSRFPGETGCPGRNTWVYAGNCACTPPRWWQCCHRGSLDRAGGKGWRAKPEIQGHGWTHGTQTQGTQIGWVQVSWPVCLLEKRWVRWGGDLSFTGLFRDWGKARTEFCFVVYFFRLSFNSNFQRWIHSKNSDIFFLRNLH